MEDKVVKIKDAIFQPGIYINALPPTSGFVLDEKFQRNASKFAIFYIYENSKLLFPFRATLFFFPDECPGLCRVLAEKKMH